MIRDQNQPHGRDAAGNALGNAGDAAGNAGDALQIAQNNQNPFNVGGAIQIGLNDNTITGKDVLPMNTVVEQREVPIGNINLAPGAVARIINPIRGNVTITGGTIANQNEVLRCYSSSHLCL